MAISENARACKRPRTKQPELFMPHDGRVDLSGCRTTHTGPAYQVRELGRDTNEPGVHEKVDDRRPPRKADRGHAGKAIRF